MDQICYWDEVAGAQKQRDATPEEQAAIDARRAQALIDAPAQLAQAALKTDADTTISGDTLIATWKAKNWATFSADFDALTNANKLEVLKRAAFATLKRVV